MSLDSDPNPSGGRRPRVRGIALVLVMWLIALLTVMALSLTTIQRTQTALTANQLDAARFRARADAVLNLTVLNLQSTPIIAPEEPDAVWVPDGRARQVRLDGALLEVRLFAETARLNLNAMSREQLAALIELIHDEATLDERKRDQLADAILDWRDTNDLTLINGAEDADYQAAGRPFGARDGAFRSIEELHQVLGMTPELYRRLAAHLTVADTGGRMSTTYADAEVLAVIQGLTLEDARQRIAEREAPLMADIDQTPTVTDRGGPLYRLEITQRDRGEGGRRMQALLRVPGERGAAFQILWRRDGLVSAPSPQASYTDGS